MKIVLNNFRNPKFNLDINPRFNSNINPKFNLKINPKYNSKINPQFNKGINPLIRLELNPFINPLLNPMRRKTAFYRHDEFPIQLGTRNFLGPLIFSLDSLLCPLYYAIASRRFASFTASTAVVEYPSAPILSA